MNNEPTSNVCILFKDHHKAIDYATWLNFKYRVREATMFHVVDSINKEPAVVSDDIWESFMDGKYTHALYEDYTDLSYERIDAISIDGDSLYLWEGIRGMTSDTDDEVLRFILEKKIPLEKFIRYELAAGGYDKNGVWVGFEEAREIWCSE